ncbi:MAG TPA: superinfection immunity protein [Candidatus Paceibacterota bacterium]|nr:superinfection immunity protein [Candidatus Paceibacterota bacterium]
MSFTGFWITNILIILYFLPTLAAFAKANKRTFEFFIFNALTAWTGLAWFILVAEAFNE